MTVVIESSAHTAAFVASVFQFFVLISGHDGLNKGKREDKLIVTSIEGAPFFTTKPDGTQEGFIPDLMKKISEKSNLTFELKVVGDKKFGSIDQSGGWDGMVGEVTREEAAIAAASLTVTIARKEAVDFTVPFMSVKLSLVTLKAADTKINNVNELADQADFKCGVLSRGSTSFFFNNTRDPTLMKVNERILSDPNNMVDSISDGLVKVRSGGGKFGMIMESVMAEYHSGQKPCDLASTIIVPEKHEYALAVQKNSDLKEKLNHALDQLKSGDEDSELERLRKKWWNSECGSGNSAHLSFQSLMMLVAVFLFSLVGYV